MPRRSCPGSASRASVLVADNAPLDEWLAFNALDFIYACDLGDHEAKGRFAAAVNARAPLARLGAAHYRRFFCAFTSPAHAAAASRVIDAARSPDPTDPQGLVREMVTGILGWRQELRERSTREVEAIHRHIGELDAALLRFKEAVAEKDAHIGKLDRRSVELQRDAIGCRKMRTSGSWIGSSSHIGGKSPKDAPSSWTRSSSSRTQSAQKDAHIAEAGSAARRSHSESAGGARGARPERRAPARARGELAEALANARADAAPGRRARATRGERTAGDSPRTRAASSS